jgi:hypothetical protein
VLVVAEMELVHVVDVSIIKELVVVNIILRELLLLLDVSILFVLLEMEIVVVGNVSHVVDALVMLMDMI